MINLQSLKITELMNNPSNILEIEAVQNIEENLCNSFIIKRKNDEYNTVNNYLKIDKNAKKLSRNMNNELIYREVSSPEKHRNLAIDSFRTKGIQKENMTMRELDIPPTIILNK